MCTLIRLLFSTFSSSHSEVPGRSLATSDMFRSAFSEFPMASRLEFQSMERPRTETDPAWPIAQLGRYSYCCYLYNVNSIVIDVFAYFSFSICFKYVSIFFLPMTDMINVCKCLYNYYYHYISLYIYIYLFIIFIHCVSNVSTSLLAFQQDPQCSIGAVLDGGVWGRRGGWWFLSPNPLMAKWIVFWCFWGELNLEFKYTVNYIFYGYNKSHN